MQKYTIILSTTARAKYVCRHREMRQIQVKNYPHDNSGVPELGGFSKPFPT